LTRPALACGKQPRRVNKYAHQLHPDATIAMPPVPAFANCFSIWKTLLILVLLSALRIPWTKTSKATEILLLPEGFVYQSLDDTEVRRVPHTSDVYRVGKDSVFKKYNLVSVDCIRSTPYFGADDQNQQHHHGTYLRLSDCSGWSFEHNSKGKRCLQQLQVTD